MARSNARTSRCFQAAVSLSAKDIAKLDAAAETYNTGDIAADYAAAIADQVAQMRTVQAAVQAALAEKSKLNMDTSWGDSSAHSIPGAYSGKSTTVTDMATFEAQFPGFSTARAQLDASGLGSLLDAVDQVIIAEDKIDFAGGLYWDPATKNLQLWLSRVVLNLEPTELAYTVRHEMGHAADGAFGFTGTDVHSANPTLDPGGDVHSEYVDRVLAGGPLGRTMDNAFDETGARQKEEMFAHIFAIATVPQNLVKLRPATRNFIEGVLTHARSNAEADISAARFAAAKEARSITRPNVNNQNPSQRSSVASAAAAPANPRPAVQRQVVNPPRTPLAPAVEAVARRIAGPTGAIIAGDTTHLLKKMALNLMSLHDVVDRFKGAVPAMADWYTGMMAATATRRQLEEDAEKIAGDAEQLKDGTGKVNEFLSRSTFEQKWGYDPKIPGKTVTVDPMMQSMWRKLAPAEQAIVTAVFAHGETMLAAKREILKTVGLSNTGFTNTGALDGPYSPLKRFGDYIVLLKSPELRAAEAAPVRDEKLIDKLRADPAHYESSSYDTMGQAKNYAYVNDLANGGKFTTDAFEKSERPNEGRVMNTEILQKVLSAMKISPDVDSPARAAAAKLVQDMYFQTLDEQNARTSGLRRKNRAGYDADMLRSFLSHARAEAGFLANLKHGGDINGAFVGMQNSVRGDRSLSDGVNIAAQHYADSLNFVETPIQDRIMALTSAWQLATSVGYHVTNFLQGAMVTVPKLASDFNNYSGAWDHLRRGYKLMNKAGWGNSFDIKKVTDLGLRAALQRAVDMGVLDVGMTEDLTHFEATRTGIAAVDGTSAVARKALHLLRKVSSSVELMNRVSAATAAYNMARENKMDTAQAQDYAIKILQSTQGDFSRVGSPLLLKKLPKFVTQYKKYQFMMMALYAKAFSQAVAGATPQEKAIGRRMLGYKLFHTGMAAGVLGMPLINLVSGVFGMLGSDDEPPDLERSLKELIGNEDLAKLLLHGPLAMAGLDMSAKLGDNNVFSILPYGEWNISSGRGFTDMVAGLLGPSVSQAKKLADGVGLIGEGEYYRGVEKMLPKGFESAMKAHRIANEGYTLKNGDLMVKPEDINGMALALDALGLPSSELKRMDWIRSQQYEIGQFYQKRTREIQRGYAAAVKAGDMDELPALREEWMNLQGGKDNLRQYFGDSQDELKKQPLSALLKYPSTQAEREQKLQRSAVTQ